MTIRKIEFIALFGSAPGCRSKTNLHQKNMPGSQASCSQSVGESQHTIVQKRLRNPQSRKLLLTSAPSYACDIYAWYAYIDKSVAFTAMPTQATPKKSSANALTSQLLSHVQIERIAPTSKSADVECVRVASFCLGPLICSQCESTRESQQIAGGCIMLVADYMS